MNRTSPGLLSSSQPQKPGKKSRRNGHSIAQAIPGFIQFKSAEGLSLSTLTSYTHDLELWLEIQGDRDLSQVTTLTMSH